MELRDRLRCMASSLKRIAQADESFDIQQLLGPTLFLLQPVNYEALEREDYSDLEGMPFGKGRIEVEPSVDYLSNKRDIDLGRLAHPTDAVRQLKEHAIREQFPNYRALGYGTEWYKEAMRAGAQVLMWGHSEGDFGWDMLRDQDDFNATILKEAYAAEHLEEMLTHDIKWIREYATWLQRPKAEPRLRKLAL